MRDEPAKMHELAQEIIGDTCDRITVRGEDDGLTIVVTPDEYPCISFEIRPTALVVNGVRHDHTAQKPVFGDNYEYLAEGERETLYDATVTALDVIYEGPGAAETEVVLEH